MKILRNLKTLLTVGAVAAVSLQLGNAQTYNLNTDFSTTTNPMGPSSVWSLARFNNTDFANPPTPGFSLNTVFTTTEPTLQAVVGNHQAWTNSAFVGSAYNSSIYKKIAGGTQLALTNQPNNTLGVVTNSGGTYRPSIIFTAPTTGLYQVSEASAWRSYNYDLTAEPGRDLTAILFRQNNANSNVITGTTVLGVTSNSAVAPNNYTAAFNTALGDTGSGFTLNAGERLVFQFQDAGQEAFAGFNYSVNSVPEPSTTALMALGVVGALLVVRRRRLKA